MKPTRGDKEWTVNLPAIDGEHVQIYQAVVKLRTALTARAGRRRMEILLRELDEEIGSHFLHEERMMRAAEYPSYGWHKRQHETARRALDELRPQFRYGNRSAISQSLQSLAGWFRDHVSVTDRMASAYLRNHERQLGSREKLRTSIRNRKPS